MNKELPQITPFQDQVAHAGMGFVQIFKPLESIQFMANRVALLEAEIERGQARRERIQAAAQRRPQHPRQEEKWWPFLRELYGTDGDIFRRTRMDRRLFEEVLSFSPMSLWKPAGEEELSGLTENFSSC